MTRLLILTSIWLACTLFSTANIAQVTMEKLDSLNLTLPEVSAPIANYVKYRKVGNLIYLAGHVPSIKGKVGADLSLEDGYRAARETGISLLATLNSALGDLNKVKQWVKVEGMVQCSADFHDQSKVINGFSDLMVAIFGENGKHARTAVGHHSLPGNYAVEISAIVEIKDD